MDDDSVWLKKEVAEEYTSFSGNREEGWYEYEVSFPAMLRLLPKGEDVSVFDYGCGPGDFANELSKKYPKIVGADISPAMIELAQKRYPGLETFVWDYHNEFPLDERFDVVFSKLVLHFVEDLDVFARAMRNVLVDGGKLVISTTHPLASQAHVSKYLGEAEYFRGIDSAEGEVKFIHRDFAHYIEPFIKNGYALTDIVEPAPSKVTAKMHDLPDAKAKQPKRLIMGFRKV